MKTLHRRLGRLEADQPRPSPYDVMDPILAEMSTPDLRLLIQRDTDLRIGRSPTAEQEAVHAALQDRLAAVGIVLP